MENKDWLKELKIGDKVIVDSSRFGQKNLSICVVNKITKKGFLKVGTSQRDMGLFREGEKKVDSYGYNHLVQWTQELEDDIRVKNRLRYNVNQLFKTNWVEVSPKKIEKIIEILDKE